jgi:ABC-type transporter Mla subunit MlaD
MSMRGARNNILAGAFVVTALALGVWMSFKLSDVPPMSGLTRFTVRFSLEDGATGLKPGSEVLLAGQQVGRVLSVNFAKENGVPTAVDVGVEVRSDVTLYEDAKVFLQLPLLGTLSSINITSVGTGTVASSGTPRIETGEVVYGRLAPPAFLTQAGFGSEQAAQLRASLASMDASLRRVSELIEKSSPMVESSIADAQHLMAELRSKLKSWTELVDRTGANVANASDRLGPLLERAETAMDGAAEMIAEMRKLVAENQDRVGTILSSLESAAEKLDQVTVSELNAALADGREAMRVFSSSLSQLTSVIKRETPSLHRTIANLRIMSDQLKLVSLEVRAQPWRLLHKPTTKELTTQVLYDATRAYAEAASDLRAASEALQAVQDEEAAAEASQHLSEALARYRAAEKALVDRLIAEERK